MKVILKEDIKGVGKKDQIVDVSDGYAKNFLFVKNKAVPVNNKSLSELNGKNNSKEFKYNQEKTQAQDLKKTLDSMTLQINAKVGENGKLFGGISTKEISQVLKDKHNLNVDKKKIDLKNPIKTLGVTTVNVRLFENVVASLKINVLEG